MNLLLRIFSLFLVLYQLFLCTSAQYYPYTGDADRRAAGDDDYYDDGAVIENQAKDLEHQQRLGVPYDQYKYISGGAGKQRVQPNNEEESKAQEVKTDKMLPAYCHPPNPCPKGQTSKDYDCQDEHFVESASWNQKLQMMKMERGLCSCDEEHMYACPRNAQLVSSKKKPATGGGDPGSAAVEEAIEDAAENGDLDLSDMIEKYLLAENDEQTNLDEVLKGQKLQDLVAKKRPARMRRSVADDDEGVEQIDSEMEDEKENLEDLGLFKENPFLNVAETKRLPVVAKKGFGL